MSNAKQVGLTYQIKKIQLLEWELSDIPGEDEALVWEVEFEVATDYESEAPAIIVTIDIACYLQDKNKEYLVYVKTRSALTVSMRNGNKPGSGTMAYLIDVALSNTRGMCAAKADEENVWMPVIPFITYKRLEETASLLVYKPSAEALSYERKPINKAIPGAAHAALILVNKRILWFTAASEADALIYNAGDEKETANFSFAYDYDLPPGKNWTLYGDVTMKIKAKGCLKMRATFTATCSSGVLFSEEIFGKVVEESFAGIGDHFKKQCEKYNIPFIGDVQLASEMFDPITTTSIQQYFGHRQKDDERNKAAFIPYLNLTQGGNTCLIMRGTFLILDQVLFLHPAFDHKHNQQAVTESMLFETIYYTLKHKCMEIEFDKISLTLFHTILLYQCLDIALQVLLSEHGDTLQPALEQNNFTQFRQQEYIRFCSSLFKQLNDAFHKPGMHIGNLDKKTDWPTVIR